MPFGITIIHTAKRGIVETFGKYTRIMKPGLNLYIPFVQRVVKRTPIFLQQETFSLQVKTKDDVFATMKMAVQYRVDDSDDDVQKSYYSLEDPVEQIDAHIQDVVRSAAPNMTLDELFSSKDDICRGINLQLMKKMKGHGYSIEKTLVTDIEPDVKVREAMNEINAQKRLKEATREKAEAKKIEIIAEAEADRERKRLQGEGIAEQRLAILRGYEEGIEKVCDRLKIDPMTGITMTLATQYFDTLERIGLSPNSKTTFIPHTPGGLTSLVDQIRDGFLQGSPHEKIKLDHEKIDHL